MLEPKRGGYYRLVTGMLHPAVLGTVVVGAMNLGSELLELRRWFPSLASMLLIWYFALDFLVTTLQFERRPNDYSLPNFLVEILLMVLLLWSFNALWKNAEVHYETFFLLVALQLFTIAIWNRIAESASGWRNEWVWKVAAAGLVLLLPAYAPRWLPPGLAGHLHALGLLFMAVLLAEYTRQFRKPDFFE